MVRRTHAMKILCIQQEVGSYMNMKANAEHTAYYYAAANIEVCKKTMTLFTTTNKLCSLQQAVESIILSALFEGYFTSHIVQ